MSVVKLTWFERICLAKRIVVCLLLVCVKLPAVIAWEFLKWLFNVLRGRGI